MYIIIHRQEYDDSFIHVTFIYNTDQNQTCRNDSFYICFGFINSIYNDNTLSYSNIESTRNSRVYLITQDELANTHRNDDNIGTMGCDNVERTDTTAARFPEPPSYNEWVSKTETISSPPPYSCDHDQAISCEDNTFPSNTIHCLKEGDNAKTEHISIDILADRQ